MKPDSTNVSDDGAISDNQSEGSSPPISAHPANISLERPDYFTIPSMQDLATLTDAKGDCIVENFSIGRVDYGCITFPGLTNVSNMNLDEIIHIRRKEVHVYPDETKKCPVGQGLNKPAEITLHRIWPTDKETKKPIIDPSRVINMGYNKKIERATIEMGAHFIDYDPSTGSWTFKVKHFSKYGLADSDEEDDDKPITIKLKSAAPSVISLMSSLDKEIEPEYMMTEKEMIQRQMKLIETRRIELTNQVKKPNLGQNLNSFTNQQWDMLNEYVIPVGSTAQQAPSRTAFFSEQSNIHLELSTDSHLNESDDEDDRPSLNSIDLKKGIRKSLALIERDLETDDNEIDDNKENFIYPSLKDFKAKSKSKSTRTAKIDKIYPNLTSIESDTFQNREST